MEKYGNIEYIYSFLYYIYPYKATHSNSIVPGTYFQNIAKPSVLVDTKYLKFNLEDDINCRK